MTAPSLGHESNSFGLVRLLHISTIENMSIRALDAWPSPSFLIDNNCENLMLFCAPLSSPDEFSPEVV